MKQSTKWWIVVLAMLLVGAVVAQVGVVSGIAYRATPLGLAAAAAALLGAMAAFAIIPLVVAAITRFRRPWVVLTLYVLCAGFAVVGIHTNAVQRDTAMTVHEPVASVPGSVGTSHSVGSAREQLRTFASEHPKHWTEDAQAWTQDSTGSAEIGPWLDYDPPGTRYCRYYTRVIYRVYPPGVRPNAPKANPFCVGDSTVRPPQ